MKGTIYILDQTDDNDNTTYDLVTSTSGNNVNLTLDASTGDDDPILITAGSNITLTENGSGTGFTIAASGGSGGSSDPVGTIVAWAGSVATIPSEYQLCDGSAASTSELQAITGANVPDLRDRFIVGAGSGYAVDATGGAATHTLTVGEMPSHDHPFPQNSNGTYDYYWIGQSDEVTDFSWSTGPSYELTTSHSVASQGGGQAHNNLPPYYALAFIMKT